MNMCRRTRTLFLFTTVLFDFPIRSDFLVPSTRCTKKEYSVYGSSRSGRGYLHANGGTDFARMIGFKQ